MVTTSQKIIKHKILFDAAKTPLKIGLKSVNVFILDNNERVISIKSLQKALGFDGKNENWLYEFLKEISVYMPIPAAILKTYQNPLIIYSTEKENSRHYVIDSIYVKETFQLILKAKNEGFLNVKQIKFSKEAQLLINDDNLADIKKAIDNVTSFALFKENMINKIIFNLLNNDSAFVWIKTFPDNFFELLMEMKKLNWKTLSQNQEKFGEIINKVVFTKIDNSLLDELRISKPKRAYRRKNSKSQDLEHPKLKSHLAILFSLAKVSGNNWNIFIQLLNKSFPEQKNKLSKKIKITDDFQTKSLSIFDENLLRCFTLKSK